MDNNTLGSLFGMWADLLDGEGGSQAALEREFVAEFQKRKLPGTTIEPGRITIGLNETRSYQFATHKAGATLCTTIRQHGSDLYVAWDVWFKPQWNLVMLAILGIISLIVAVANIDWSYLRGSNFMMGIGSGVLAFCILFVLVAVAGKLIKGRWDGFLRTALDYFVYEDTWVLRFAVDHSLRAAAERAGLKRKLREWNPDAGQGGGGGSRLI